MNRILALAILFLLGCGQKKVEEVYEKACEVDSLIEHSNKNLDTVEIVDHKTDSLTKVKFIEVVKEVKHLNNEVEKYKEIATKTVTSEKIVYKVDTIYIETKKNFWGKEKTNTTIKSDSTVSEKIDSTIENSY